MTELGSLITLADLAERGAQTHDERLAFYDAAATAFSAICPERAAAAKNAATALRAAERLQLTFRELLTR